ncbi:MAG TPA: LexA family transcriptional regulator [Phycisphaerales bacterium]|nr:LexA family transcriptional regulator [Phycisphaerales bacterium]
MTCASGHSDDRPDEAPNPSIGAVIRARRAALGWSLQELAARVGCARSYLSMIETGTRGDEGAAIGPILLVRLESTLGLAPGLLTKSAQWSATPPEVRRHVAAMESSQRAAAAQLRAMTGSIGANLDEAFRSGRLHALVARLECSSEEARPNAAPGRLLPVQVPLINSVAAGYPREFTDLGYPARVADEYVLSPDVDDPDAFAARVVGDSMLPTYREGDIVVFSPARPVKSGMDCFVRLERDAETTFKRVVFEEGSPAIRLVALNAAFPERVVDREDVALLCAAVSVTRRIG